MANAVQTTQWNTALGERWVRLRSEMDAAFGEHGRRVLDAARLSAGESVLDIGCGSGTLTLAAAELVGPEGRVLGADISEPLLACARSRAVEAKLGQVRFEKVDVQTGTLSTSEFDAAISRLGVMFFEDPVAAFANVHRALRRGGRLSFVAWQSAAANPWVDVPEKATAAFVELAKPDPNAPGPYSFAEPDRIRRVLEQAGFAAIGVDALNVDILFGADPRAAAGLVSQFGVLGRALLAADPALQARALAAIEAALEPYTTPSGVSFPSRAWLVRAARDA